MSRWEYFLKRVLLSIPVLFLVITFLFIMLRLGPIDPVSALLGPNSSGADVQAVREQLGLNQPLWRQYLTFAHDLLLFDGQSWVVQNDRAVLEFQLDAFGNPDEKVIGGVIGDTAPPTLWLGFWSITLPLLIGIPLGFYAGLNSNSIGDYLASASGILWLAMPNFWLCIMLLATLRQTDGGGPFGFDWYSFVVDLDSITGTPDLAFFATEAGLVDWTALAADIKFILPPALVLGSASMAAELRIARTAVLETANSNYVETAKAKGVKGRTIVSKHIFRNALIPLLPVITNEAFLLIGGSVIVEAIFNINGLGRTFFQALIQGDLPLAGSLLFLFTLIIIGLNIVQDLLYTIIDPRVGYEQ